MYLGLATDDPALLAFIERFTRIKYEVLDRTLAAAAGRVDGVWIGEESHVLVSKNEIRNVQFAVTSDSKDTEVIDNILRNDEMRPETEGVHIPKNVDTSLIAENTIEGFEVATFLGANSTSEADSRRDGV